MGPHRSLGQRRSMKAREHGVNLDGRSIQIGANASNIRRGGRQRLCGGRERRGETVQTEFQSSDRIKKDQQSLIRMCSGSSLVSPSHFPRLMLKNPIRLASSILSATSSNPTPLILALSYSHPCSPFSSLNDPVNGDDPLLADELFKPTTIMGSYKPGDSTFYSLIEAYANIGDIESVDKVLDRVKAEKRVLLERNFILIFKAYGRAHLPDKAIDLFHRMVSEFQCKRSIKSFNSVLNVIIQERLYSCGLEFYGHVCLQNDASLMPNLLTFNLVMKAFCKLGLVDKAIEVFREMPGRDCVPDVYSYCTLMDGLCKKDRMEEAILLLDEMQKEGCFPNSATFNVLINGLCRKGDFMRIAKLVDNMFLKGCAPNEVTYNTLIHGLCLQGKLDKAVSLLDRMVSSNCVPNEVTYGTIVNGLVNQKRSLDASRVLILMEERGYQVNEYVYSSLLSGLFKEGKSDKAIQLFKEKVEKGNKLNIVIFSVMIDGFCREGRTEEALNILSIMENKGCKPNVFTYSSLMKGFFDQGNSQKALELWNDMEKEKCTPNEVCYSVLINGLCKDGKINEAKMSWTQMLAKGYEPDVVSYSSMINGLCNSDLVEEAMKFFNEMLCREHSCQPDVVTYNILLNALCKQDSLGHAINLLNKMLERGCDPDSVTCNIFLTVLNEKLNPPEDGRKFLDELVVRLLKQERILGALSIVQVMLQKFLAPSASTWLLIINEICGQNQTHSVIQRCISNLNA